MRVQKVWSETYRVQNSILNTMQFTEFKYW